MLNWRWGFRAFSPSMLRFWAACSYFSVVCSCCEFLCVELLSGPIYTVFLKRLPMKQSIFQHFSENLPFAVETRNYRDPKLVNMQRLRLWRAQLCMWQFYHNLSSTAQESSGKIEWQKCKKLLLNHLCEQERGISSLLVFLSLPNAATL